MKGWKYLKLKMIVLLITCELRSENPKYSHSRDTTDREAPSEGPGIALLQQRRFDMSNFNWFRRPLLRAEK